MSEKYPGGQMSDLYYDTCGYIDKDGELIYPEPDPEALLAWIAERDAEMDYQKSTKDDITKDSS